MLLHRERERERPGKKTILHRNDGGGTVWTVLTRSKNLGGRHSF